MFSYISYLEFVFFDAISLVLFLQLVFFCGATLDSYKVLMPIRGHEGGLYSISAIYVPRERAEVTKQIETCETAQTNLCCWTFNHDEMNFLPPEPALSTLIVWLYFCVQPFPHDSYTRDSSIQSTLSFSSTKCTTLYNEANSSAWMLLLLPLLLYVANLDAYVVVAHFSDKLI